MSACGVKDEHGHKCDRENEPINDRIVRHSGVHQDKGYWWLGKWRRTSKVGTQAGVIPRT